jgi:hypothetical protein
MGLMRKKALQILSYTVVVAMLCIVGSSCNKDTKCQGDIYVVRKNPGAGPSFPAAGTAVVNSKVWVYYASKSFIGYTDVTGRFHVELDLPAILSVSVYAPVGFGNAINPLPMADSAASTLKFEAGKTNSVTLAL